MSLDTRPAKPLTSREIAKVIASVCGGLAQWCDPADIEAAFGHFHQHADTYKKAWLFVHDAAKQHQPPVIS